MKKNKLRELLKSDTPTIGTRIYTVWPGVVELIGYCDEIDYVEFLGEYVSYTLHDLENIARAVELSDMSSLMKIDQENQAFVAKRALGAGIQNILFTDVRNIEQARECVRIVRAETPERTGINGCHARRNVKYGIEAGSPEYVKAMDDVVIMLMVEKKSAVENLEEIISVEGIDMVQFGPCDYAMSIGLPGQFAHPKVKEAELKTIKTALKVGARPRAEIGSIDNLEENAQKYIDLGVRDFSLPPNASVQYQWFKKNSENVRRMLSGI